MRSAISRSARHRLMLAGIATAIVVAAILAGVLFIRPSVPEPAAAPGTGARTSTVTTVDGQRLTVPDGKPAVLTFIAANCGDCVPDLQTLGAVRAEAADRATFLAVGVDPSASTEDITGLLRAAGYPDLPAAQDSDGALLRTYQVTSLGTVVVLDPAGTVAYQEVKPSTEDLRAALSRAGVAT